MKAAFQHIKLSDFNQIYFLGIGGIGMSALARYFNANGFDVAGYDKTESELTQALVSEGIAVHYQDLNNSIPTPFNDNATTLIVMTPAVPKNLGELVHFQYQEFTILKRSEVLGLIAQESKGLGVAGTHGKTTTSTMLAHILAGSKLGCTAFLGGISSNYGSNLLINTESEYTVIEADEFDRSFLRLSPFASIVTSADPDHLDIYGDESTFREGFELYTQSLPVDGLLVQRAGLDLPTSAQNLTYCVEGKADYIGYDLRYEEGIFKMDVSTPVGVWKDVHLGIPGIHNAENAVACIALTLSLGLSEEVVRKGLSSFLGVKRRFEYHIKSQNLIYIDDYAHHPTEIKALIDSVRLLYPDQRVTGVFQPHLFSRTRDFMDGFVRELSRLDELILMPIYPAREEPIPGVSSDVLLERVTNADKAIMRPDEVVAYLSKQTEGVFLTIGAGDIDRIVKPLKAGWL